MKLIAAASVAIVAAGIVTAPTTTAPVPLHYAPVAQLRTDAVDLAAAVVSAPGAAAATPRADAAPQTPQEFVTSVVVTAAALGVIPLWYAAFPITLPASFFVAAVAYSALGLIGYQPVAAPIFIVGAGAIGWAVAPLMVLKLVSDFWTAPKPNPAPVSASNPAARSSSASQTPRHDDRVKRGVAGSRRTAAPNADRAPTGHRSAKSTSQTTAKSQAGASGSGRGVAKTARR